MRNCSKFGIRWRRLPTLDVSDQQMRVELVFGLLLAIDESRVHIGSIQNRLAMWRSMIFIRQ